MAKTRLDNLSYRHCLGLILCPHSPDHRLVAMRCNHKPVYLKSHNRTTLQSQSVEKAIQQPQSEVERFRIKDQTPVTSYDVRHGAAKEIAYLKEPLHSVDLNTVCDNKYRIFGTEKTTY